MNVCPVFVSFRSYALQRTPQSGFLGAVAPTGAPDHSLLVLNINLDHCCFENTVRLFNFASDLFSRYSRGRYYRKNKSPRKFNTSSVANGTS